MLSGRRRRQAVRELLREWNPLEDNDPSNPHVARDEYDWLARGIERELDDGADARRLVTYMTNAVQTRYGLNDPPSADPIAERLLNL